MKRILLFAACCFAAALLVGHESLAMPKENIFTKGETRVYQVVLPRRGFVGAPFSTSGIPAFRRPTRKEDFETRFVKVIVVVAKRGHGEGQRAVLRVDEIDKNGGLLVEGLYYAYVDMLPQGSRVVCRYADDGSDTARTGIRYGIPFPFTCAKPPAAGFKKGNTDGHVDQCGEGVGYVLKKGGAASAPDVQVEATRFRLPDAFRKDGIPTVYWSDSDTAALIKAEPKATIFFREKQQWDKADDWLWKKMERFDAKGNVLMRCVLTKQTSAPPGGKEASEGAGGNRE